MKLKLQMPLTPFPYCAARPLDSATFYLQNVEKPRIRQRLVRVFTYELAKNTFYLADCSILRNGTAGLITVLSA